MHIAVFTPGYGAEGAGAAGLRWHWLAKHLTLAGADVTIFHNAEGSVEGRSEAVREVYLPGLTFERGTSLKVVSRAAHWMKSQARFERLRRMGHYLASALLRYRETPWERQVIEAFEQVHAEKPVSVVIGVCAPWSTAVAARQVARRWRLPYLIEFQDPWRDFFDEGSWRLHHNFVRNITAEAAAVINVCEHWCEMDRDDLHRPSLCVPNGFEPSLVSPAGPTSAEPTLQLAYVGTAGYIGEATIDLLWQGLSQVESPDWSFDYAGGDGALFRSGVERWGLQAQFNISSTLPQAEALKLLGGADALVLFAHPTRASHFGSKFPEYMASRRPIILLGRRDRFLIKAADRLTRLIVCEDARQLARTVEQLAEEKRVSGQLLWHGDEQGIESLSWPNIAEQLYSELPEIVTASRGDRVNW